jgi:hypothetical protein
MEKYLEGPLRDLVHYNNNFLEGVHSLLLALIYKTLLSTSRKPPPMTLIARDLGLTWVLSRC